MLIAPLLLALGCCDDLQLQTELNNKNLTFPYAKVNSYTECTENVPGMISDDFANKFASQITSDGELLFKPTNQKSALTDFFLPSNEKFHISSLHRNPEDNDKYFTSLLVERKSNKNTFLMMKSLNCHYHSLIGLGPILIPLAYPMKTIFM